MNQQPISPIVTSHVALQVLDARGRSVDLPARLAYDPEDPWAVEITFGAPADDVRWLVGRDLLITGTTDPTGEGDVLLWPSIDEHGCAAVVLELCSPNGRLVAQVSTRELGAFLASTLAVVPQGQELVDLDRLVVALTASEAQ